MQLHEAHEVIEVMGAHKASEALAQGWTLLAVTNATDFSDKSIRPCYIFGKRKPTAPAKSTPLNM